MSENESYNKSGKFLELFFNRSLISFFVLVYFLDGLIGVGKSSVLNELKKKHSELKVYCEPIIDYQYCSGANPLLDFYLNLTGSAFRFQLIALMANYENFELSRSANCKSIVERSVDSSFNVFTKTLYDSGSLTSIEFRIIEKLYNLLHFECKKNIIYLKGSPALCLKRIRERARVEEKGLTIKYLELIDWTYEKLINNLRKRESCTVYEIDADQDVSLIADRVYEIMKK